MKPSKSAIDKLMYGGRQLPGGGWTRDIRYFDGQPPGFGIRPYPSGKRVFILRYTSPTSGKRRFIPLGAYGELTPQEAHDKAVEARRLITRDGIDPLDKRKAERAALLSARDGRYEFRVTADSFLERYAKKETTERTWKETERILNKYVLPKWGRKDIRDIRLPDVVELLDGIEDKNGPVMANRTLAATRKLFNWAMVKRGLIETMPIGPGMAFKEKPRKRWLKDREVKALWKACDKAGWPYGPFTQMLILTGQRRGEVAGMRWGHISKDVWTIPAEDTKTDTEHGVPLSGPAQKILDAMPRLEGCGYVFGTGRRGDKPLSGFTQGKTVLNEVFRAKQPWTFHDLRRTVRTHLSEIGTNNDVAERALNHARRGVEGVYDQHAYMPEKRYALEAWADKITRLLDGKTAATVNLNAERKKRKIGRGKRT